VSRKFDTTIAVIGIDIGSGEQQVRPCPLCKLRVLAAAVICLCR
jgi:hypothetical protein